MGTFIFLTAVLVEIAFGVYCIITKSNQHKVRSIIRITYFACFTTLVILQIIEWGFRYYALGTLLLLLAVMGAVTIIRKEEEKRSFREKTKG